MNIDNSPTNKYILVDTALQPPYAKLSSATLSAHEAKVKNTGFAMNRVAKKYILEKDWK